MDKRPEISAKNPSIRMVDMAKELSKMWNELTDKTVRKFYENSSNFQ